MLPYLVEGARLLRRSSNRSIHGFYFWSNYKNVLRLEAPTTLSADAPTSLRGASATSRPGESVRCSTINQNSEDDRKLMFTYTG
jgi:hypothetical protein